MTFVNTHVPLPPNGGGGGVVNLAELWGESMVGIAQPLLCHKCFCTFVTMI